MKRLLLIALLPLVGCAGNLRLLEEGKSHAGTWNAATRTLEVTIEGRKYSGGFNQNATQTFGTVYGRRPIFGSGVSTDGTGQAVLTSDDGKVIQCQFQASLGRGSGQCEGMDGRRYAMIIGG